MIPTKETLSEALAVLSNAWEGAEYEDAVGEELLALAAARFVERLLPEKCWRHPDVGIPAVSRAAWACDVCHGTGQLWDEGLVEVVAKALWEADGRPMITWAQTQARAVLTALAAEVGRG